MESRGRDGGQAEEWLKLECSSRTWVMLFCLVSALCTPVWASLLCRLAFCVPLARNERAVAASQLPNFYLLPSAVHSRTTSCLSVSILGSRNRKLHLGWLELGMSGWTMQPLTRPQLLGLMAGGWEVLGQSSSDALDPHLRKCLQLEILPQCGNSDWKSRSVRESEV